MTAPVQAGPTAAGPTRARERRWLLTALKGGVSAALILCGLRRSNLGEVWAAVLSADLALLAAAALMGFLGPHLGARRWRVLLRAHGGDAPTSVLLTSYLVGIFFNNLLPSTIGGDASRIYDSWRLGTGKARAVLVVVVERGLGLFTLVVFALGALVALPDLAPRWVWVVVPAGAAASVLLTCRLPWPARPAARSPLPFARPLGRVLEKLRDARGVFQDQRSALARALGLSVALQITVVLHYYLIARALGFPIPLPYFFLAVPLALVLMMIPVSINAIGIRENAFAVLFAGYGVSTPEAVAFAWLAYGMVLLQGLIGGVLYAFRR